MEATVLRTTVVYPVLDSTAAKTTELSLCQFQSYSSLYAVINGIIGLHHNVQWAAQARVILCHVTRRVSEERIVSMAKSVGLTLELERQLDGPIRVLVFR